MADLSRGSESVLRRQAVSGRRPTDTRPTHSRTLEGCQNRPVFPEVLSMALEASRAR